MKREDTPESDRRSIFQRLLKRRETAERGRRSEQRQSLEGLRLAALMKQMQALQAIQGLQELAPSKRPGEPRLAISPDPEERTRQRQWLEYKADWLQAMLEDTVSELEAMDRFDADLAAGRITPRDTSGSPGGNGSGDDNGDPGGNGATGGNGMGTP